jgi:limonene 1,2-monooxygenase
MRFGLFMQPVHHLSENPTLSLERDLQLIEWLDQLGYDEAWIGEHHSSGWMPIASPDIFIASAAARTRHIKLGSAVVPLSIHHPLLVADNYVLLDHLTRGRVILGVGSGGGLPSDPYVFGLKPQEQQPRFVESLNAILRLLESPEPFSIKTAWFELREAVLQLRSYTYPRLPVAIVTDKNRESLELVGQYADYWLTSLLPDQFEASWQIVERSALQSGRSFERHQVSIAVNLHLAETREQALNNVQVGSAVERYDFSSAVTGSAVPTVERDQWVNTLSTRPTDIIGTPQEAIQKIKAIQQQTGVGGLIIRSKEWATREANLKSFELFARYVMPEFQGSLAGLRAAEGVAKKYTNSR